MDNKNNQKQDRWGELDQIENSLEKLTKEIDRITAEI